MKLCFDCLGKKSRKEEKSEDASVALSAETKSVINSDSLEKLQDVSAHGAPLSLEAHNLLTPDYLSTKMKEKKR